MEGFKSSPTRLARIFKEARDAWKEKALKRQEELRKIYTRVRDLTRSRNNWKERAMIAEDVLKKIKLQQSQCEKKDVVNQLKVEIEYNDENKKDPPSKGELIQYVNNSADKREPSTQGGLIPYAGNSISSPPKNHHYPVHVIQLAIQLVIEGMTSFRGTQRNFELFSQFFDIHNPCFTTIRTWVLRLGLYNLKQNSEFRSDWVIIFDHTIESGQTKCLLTLGIPHEQFNKKIKKPGDSYSLCHQDVVVLDIDAMTNSNGLSIKQKLDDLTCKIGVPLQIVSDNGSDLKKGVSLYKQQHPEVIHTYDVTHKMASLIKKEINKDERYEEFSKKYSQTANETRQTALSFLNPRSERTKSRYLNIERHIEWGKNILEYEEKNDYSLLNRNIMLDSYAFDQLRLDMDKETLDKLSSLKNKEFLDKSILKNEICLKIGENIFKKHEEKIFSVTDMGKRYFETKIGWVKEYKDDIEMWSEMLDIINTANKQVKERGLKKNSHKDFIRSTKKTLKKSKNLRTEGLVKDIIAYLKDETKNLPKGQTFLGSSDVIESIFGKYKIFSSSGPLKEVGKMILTIPIFTAKITSKIVKLAMETVKIKDVEEWAEHVFGQSDLSKRRQAFCSNAKDTKSA